VIHARSKRLREKTRRNLRLYSSITVLAIAGVTGCLLPGARPRTVQTDAVREPPVLIGQAIPTYPEDARRARIEGEVYVEMVVGSSGTVDSIIALRGPFIFREAAREAALNMRFTPGKSDGVPVPYKVSQRISFRLEDIFLERRYVTPVESLVLADVDTGAEAVFWYWAVDEKPTLSYQVIPTYPDPARQAGVEGDVYVELVLGTDGSVESAEVLQGPPIFHEPAHAAAMAMRFIPAKRDGRPVRARLAQHMSFRLSRAAAGAPAGGRVTVEPWTQEEKPVLIRRGVAVYPDSARQARIEGDVLVELVVGTDGRVESATILSGPPVFHEAARAAAMNTRFLPAKLNFRPVRVKVTHRIRFRLGEGNP